MVALGADAQGNGFRRNAGLIKIAILVERDLHRIPSTIARNEQARLWWHRLTVRQNHAPSQTMGRADNQVPGIRRLTIFAGVNPLWRNLAEFFHRAHEGVNLEITVRRKIHKREVAREPVPTSKWPR